MTQSAKEAAKEIFAQVQHRSPQLLSRQLGALPDELLRTQEFSLTIQV